MNPDLQALGLVPGDDADRRLAATVAPGAGGAPPVPAARYDLLVIGAGAAGLVAAAGAAGLGARVALAERHLMGGDCLVTGCVPSKALLAAAHAAHAHRRAAALGIHAPRPAVDFAAVMRRLRGTRAAIAPNDGWERFRALGVDVFPGPARFLRDGEAEAGGTVVRWRKAIVATGARAALPDVPGLAAAQPLTHATVFNLDALPPRLAVVGAGPVGCELAQAFRRLGSDVTLVASGPRPLPRDEPGAGDALAAALRADGVQVLAGARVVRVEGPPGAHRLHVATAGGTAVVEADRILVAAGRLPNVEGLGLDAVGVEHDARDGVRVDDRLRTTNRRILAAGDVCLREKFTHAADFSARLAVQNALFHGRRRWSSQVVPWCTYTDPEVAHVGWTAADAGSRGVRTTAYERAFADVDRARATGETDGFVRVRVREGTDEIVGATVVGARAGEMIGELALAMTARVGLVRLASVIHPYPTFGEAIRQCGDACNRARLTPGVRWLLRQVLRWG